MHSELYKGKIVGDSIVLAKEILDYFESDPRAAEGQTIVTNKDLKGNLTLFKIEEWEKYEKILSTFDMKNEHARKAHRFLLGSAADTTIEYDTVAITPRLSKWFRDEQKTNDYEFSVVMYVDTQEEAAFERVSICLERNYKKE